jgi:hypothetical protein
MRIRALRTSAVGSALLALAALVGLLVGGPAAAEPYLAVEAGLKCAQCHVNPTGGGKRTPFGELYARGQISADTVNLESNVKPWTGEVTKWFATGADVRGGYESVATPGQPQESDFSLTRATAYLDFTALPNLLSFYFDEKVAPDNVENREAYVLYTPHNGRYVIKAGQMFLPFGLRLQDDDAFVRQASGVNFRAPDDGIELGLELPKWSAQLTATKGAPDNGSDDRLSLSAVYVLPRWRVGASYNKNPDPFGDREMEALFAGWKTGPIAWLAELDFITDELPPSGSNRTYATLIEGNWRVHKGHNLKVTYEFLDPSNRQAEDQQERYSAVWEYSPIQFVQSRVGIRRYNGIPNIPTSNRDEWFAELHVYF